MVKCDGISARPKTHAHLKFKSNPSPLAIFPINSKATFSAKFAEELQKRVHFVLLIFVSETIPIIWLHSAPGPNGSGRKSQSPGSSISDDERGIQKRSPP